VPRGVCAIPDLELIEFMIKRGARINEGPITPLHAVTAVFIEPYEGYEDLDPEDLNEIDDESDRFFRVKDLGDTKKAMARLIQAGANVNARDSQGDTPLHKLAAYPYADKEAVRILIAAGANVEAVNAEGRTPLHVAALSPACYKNTAYLIGLGKVKTEARDPEGLTPLHWAAMKYRAQAVQALPKNGANINAKSNKGITPLALGLVEMGSLSEYSMRPLFSRRETFRELQRRGARVLKIEIGRLPRSYDEDDEEVMTIMYKMYAVRAFS
jgi:ankyrin repeat protein